MIKPNPQVLQLSEQLNYIANVGINRVALALLIANQMDSLNEHDVNDVLNGIATVIEVYLSEREDDA
jgi:hypothetical protein